MFKFIKNWFKKEDVEVPYKVEVLEVSNVPEVLDKKYTEPKAPIVPGESQLERAKRLRQENIDRINSSYQTEYDYSTDYSTDYKRPVTDSIDSSYDSSSTSSSSNSSTSSDSSSSCDSCSY